MGLHPEGGEKLWQGSELEGVAWPGLRLGARWGTREDSLGWGGIRFFSGRSGKPVQPGVVPSDGSLVSVPWLAPLCRGTGRGQETEP